MIIDREKTKLEEESAGLGRTPVKGTPTSRGEEEPLPSAKNSQCPLRLMSGELTAQQKKYSLRKSPNKAALDGLKAFTKSLLSANRRLDAPQQVGPTELFGVDFVQIVPCEGVLVLSLSADRANYAGTFGGLKVTVPRVGVSRHFFEFVWGMTRPKVVNLVQLNDELARSVEALLGYKIASYIAVPRKSAEGGVEELLMFMNSKNKECFGRPDEVLAHTLSATNKLLLRVGAYKEMYERERMSKARICSEVVDLLSSVSVAVFPSRRTPSRNSWRPWPRSIVV